MSLSLYAQLSHASHEKVFVDNLKFGLAEKAEISNGTKIFETAAKSRGQQIIRKQVVSGSQQKKINSAESIKIISGSRCVLKTNSRW